MSFFTVTKDILVVEVLPRLHPRWLVTLEKFGILIFLEALERIT